MPTDNEIERLKRDLSDPRWGVRQAAVKELGMLGNAAASALPELIRALDDTDEGIRWLAAQAAGNLGCTSSALLAALRRRLTDSSPSVAIMARYALIKIDEQPEIHLGEIIKALHQGENEAVSAAQALGQLGQRGSPALDTLSELLQHSNDKVKWYSQRAIDSIKAAESSAQKKPPEKFEIDALISQLQGAAIAGNEKEAFLAAEALAKLKIPVVPIVEGFLAQGNEKLREVSLSILGRLGVEGITCLARLAEMAGEDQDSLGSIAHVLETMSAEATSILLEQLRSRDKDVYNRAVIGLSLLRGAAIIRISAALGSFDSQVPPGAAAALINIGHEAVKSVLSSKQFFIENGMKEAVKYADYVLLEISKQG